ncbi:hypothetical protein V2S85_05200 [Novosphingobium resinovorum]|nr:hypothetical protein [Novosphingobium resinovorum]
MRFRQVQVAAAYPAALYTHQQLAAPGTRNVHLADGERKPGAFENGGAHLHVSLPGFPELTLSIGTRSEV